MNALMPLLLSAFTDRDRTALLDLWARALPLDAITETTLETRVLLDENFNPELFLVARNDQRLMGFILGHVDSRMTLAEHDPDGTRSWITAIGVDPEVDIEEVGTRLLAGLEERFRVRNKRECYVASYPTGYFTPGIDRTHSAVLLRFLEGKGYQEVKQAISMDAPIILFQVPPKTVELERQLAEQGIVIRVYRRDDLIRFLSFLERTMQTDWVRVERANLKKIATGGFSPEQISLVLKGDEIVGYCQFEGSHFGPFGVSEKYQGRGIGTVLLARTLERMRMQGFHNAWVMWTDDVAAKVYAKFGFTETRRFSILRKSLA
jgi:mycothiol synthase